MLIGLDTTFPISSHSIDPSNNTQNNSKDKDSLEEKIAITQESIRHAHFRVVSIIHSTKRPYIQI